VFDGCLIHRAFLGFIHHEWSFNFGGVEVWGHDASFIFVSEHFEDVILFDLFENIIISFKSEFEI
jgi:hypothetical protein